MNNNTSTQKNKIRICVVFGGRSGEHAVSLLSAQSVLAALDPAKYEVFQVGITREGAWIGGKNVLAVLSGEANDVPENVTFLPDPTRPGLYRLSASDQGSQLEWLQDLDVVFPVLHGTFGEDGALQGLLELADVAYVGPGVLAAALAMDKSVFKDVMRSHGIPVLDHILVLRSDLEKHMDSLISRAEALAPYPLFTKPANLGSSVGISKCRNRSDLVEGMLEASQFDRRVLVEVGIAQARELEVAVLGNQAPRVSIVGEIVPHGDFYSYDAKYHDDLSQLLIPAPISAELSERVRTLALQAYQAIDGAGLARVDFLLDERTGALFLNEINTIPGFTRISMYPKLWEASGLSYSQLVDQLVELALARKAERDATVRDYHKG